MIISIKEKIWRISVLLYISYRIVPLYMLGFFGVTPLCATTNNVSIHEKSIQNLKLENEQLTKNLNVLGVELEVARLTQQQHFVEIGKRIER